MIFLSNISLWRQGDSFMRKILFATSECVPFVKTGGLADVCGALPKGFNKDEWDVRVVLPNYTCIPDHFRNNFKYITHFYMGTGSYNPGAHVGVMTYEYEGVTYYFIDNLVYFGGSKPYGDFRTDIEKFAFFDKAVLSILPIVGFRPDLIHCHDWQTGLIPVYLKTEFAAGEFYRGIKSVMTIHNLRFQGIWDVETMQGLTGLPDYVFTPDKLEYKRDANMLKGGLVYDDCQRNLCTGDPDTAVWRRAGWTSFCKTHGSERNRQWYRLRYLESGDRWQDQYQLQYQGCS